jgi:hypothetical protein
MVNCSNGGLVISGNIQENRVDDSSCFTTEAIYDKNRKAVLPNSFARHVMGLSTIIGRPNKEISCGVVYWMQLCFLGWKGSEDGTLE